MLLVYLPVITFRTEYIFRLIFKNELGLNYLSTTDLKLFQLHEEEKINYSGNRINNEFFIKASPLLFEHFIKDMEIPVEKKYGTTVLFNNDEFCDIGFDIFSAVFYMVSRYEEYLPFIADKYGRYKASDSLAYKNNFLQYPIVNIWINLFKNLLQKKFSSLNFRTTSFKAIFTYDIDVAFAYKGRGVIRQVSATIKDLLLLKFKNVLQRLVTLLNIRKDPWDVYDFLYSTISKNNLHSIFFFLLSDYSSHDKNLHHDNQLMRKLITKISAYNETGIHPSFTSSMLPEKIVIEKKRLEKLSNKEITISRQHYLKFKLPDTYNYLIDSGITQDYSMGFADMPGFRAGTCSPFYFYDLKLERPTTLKIFPITFMEGTFIDYMKLCPGESLQYIYDLIEQVKNVNGTFISIWHNHTVSETKTYKAWRDVHNKMIERILS